MVSEPINSEASENTVLVMGAGLSGVFTALEAAKKNYRVVLIEQGNQIIPYESSSYNECYKLHTGLHYAGNPKTALKCLEDSVAFARLIPVDCLAGSIQLDAPWRRGRHFIMSNSLFPAENIEKVALLLKKRYTELVLEDPKNKVFGAPEEFIKFLSRRDYPYIAENILFTESNRKKRNIQVVLGIETGESQINILKLRAYLNEEIKKNKNIIFIPNTKVINLSHLPDQLGYSVTVIRQKESETWHVPAIINCTWQNIEYFSKQLGFYTPDENRVIRVKVCIKVRLPESLKNVNTCIFSIGPFSSLTNLGNGEAVLASESTTNIGYYKAGTREFSPALMKIYGAKLTPEEGVGGFLAEKILRECALYLPDLIQSKVLEIMLGHVKMIHISTPYKGLPSLYDANSAIHQRLERGVEVESGGLGYIANSGNKMTYTVHNAKEACKRLDHHLRLSREFYVFLNNIKPKIVAVLKKLGKDHEKYLTDPLLFSVCKKSFLSVSARFSTEFVLSNILETIKRKEEVLALIRNGYSYRTQSDSKKLKPKNDQLFKLRAKL